MLADQVASGDSDKRLIKQIHEVRFDEQTQKNKEVRLKSKESEALIAEVISIASKEPNKKITISITETVVGGGSANSIIVELKKAKILDTYPNLTIKLLLLQQTGHSKTAAVDSENEIKKNLDKQEPKDFKDLGKIKTINSHGGKLQVIFSQTSYIIGEDVDYQLAKNMPNAKKPVIIFSANLNNIIIKSITPKGESTARDVIVELIKGKFDNILNTMK